MEISYMCYSQFKIYNPLTDEIIVDEECDDNAKSLIAYWLDDSIFEPIINNETLKAAWEAFAERHEEDNGESPCWEDLIKFLEEYSSAEWTGYEITSYGMACGPVTSTVVFIVDRDVIVEELDGEEMDTEDDQ